MGNTLRFWPQPRRRSLLGRLLVAARAFALLAILVALAVGLDPALVEPPALLSSVPERIDQRFTRCGPGRGHACVVDGDTFKLGRRRIRIIGIDAPETHPARCPEEARLGEQATARLQVLLNQGPFELVAPAYGGHDQYGRDLRVVQRTGRDGRIVSIGAQLRDEGLVHRYTGFKTSWC